MKKSVIVHINITTRGAGLMRIGYQDFGISRLVKHHGNVFQKKSFIHGVFYLFFYLKVASLIWPDMQGTRHAAAVDYRKCLVTPQIRSNKVPEGENTHYFK